MKIKFWGVRGSIPTPGKSTVLYGGNTYCASAEIEEKNGMFIFDAGTGIRECGMYLLSKRKKIVANIFITHTHWDHIQGFPFFVPSFIPGNIFDIYGPPSDVNPLNIKKIMEFQTNYEYFPISINQLGAQLNYIDCKIGKIEIPNFEIYTHKLNHPVSCFAYKIIENGKIFIFGGDHEPFSNIYRDAKTQSTEIDEEFLEELDKNAEEQNKNIYDFCKNADLVIWDGQYTEEEYKTKKGWGHSYIEADLLLAKESGIKYIVISHHDPLSTDAKLEKMENEYKSQAEKMGFKLSFAREGMEIEL